MNTVTLYLLRVGLIVLFITIVGCKNSSKDNPADLALDGQCEEPRPQICTRDYRPVCGFRDTGVRCVTKPCASNEWKTYGNACSACGDPDVAGYRHGECPAEDDAT